MIGQQNYLYLLTLYHALGCAIIDFDPFTLVHIKVRAVSHLLQSMEEPFQLH